MKADVKDFIFLSRENYANSLGYDKEQMGGKAFNIKRMLCSNINVPPAINMTTGWTFEAQETGGFDQQSYFSKKLVGYVRFLAEKTDTTWNLDHGKPLIVSVRSGAPISMPGMMDTILNIGLRKSNLENFSRHFGGSEVFALDSYRRLIQMFGSTVCDIDNKLFQEIMDAAKVYFVDMDSEAYLRVIQQYERLFHKETGTNFPECPDEQLLESTNAVFRSWFSPRAVEYRKIENISDDIGTSATVQQMVFGNMNSNSGTGVVFSHNPNTGQSGLYGDFLVNAQGEDVVAGTHTTKPIDSMKDSKFDKQYRQLQSSMKNLLDIERDMLDVEFTIEDGELYILQFRVAKRSRKADIRMIVDDVRQGIRSPEDAVSNICNHFPSNTSSDDSEDLSCIGNGIGTVDGIGSGVIAIGHEAAEKFTEEGKHYIYVATETSPDDVRQLKNSNGILTAKGGILSHAAVVALGWGKPCVVGFEAMIVNEDHCIIDGNKYENGSNIKIDGETGQVFV